jgi:hypothetical protein
VNGLTRRRRALRSGSTAGAHGTGLCFLPVFHLVQRNSGATTIRHRARSITGVLGDQ